MKKLIGGILCSAAIVLTSASTAMAAGKVLNESEESSIKQYFTDILNERTPSAPIPTKISVNSKNYNELRNELWSIWSQANKEFDEPQLVEPMNLKAEGYDRRNPVPNGMWPITGGDMKYLFGHKGDMPEKGWPLYLYLHGSGGNDHEFMAGASWCAYFDDMPSLYFIPRSPEGGTGCRWYQPSRQKAWERLLRQSYIAGNVDPNKVYIMGISEGGYGSQRLASFYADYLAGVGPIAGGEPFYNCDPANTANIAYCQQTGELDTMYGRSRVVAKAQKEWDRLQKEHPGYYTHKIDLQPGRYHGCDYTRTTPWLKSFTRNPWPKYVYWENQAIGNVNGEGARARTGFYNIHVIDGQNGASDSPDRDVYEMKITGNTIDLDVKSVHVTPDDEVSENGWTMKLGATRTFTPATKGAVRIYLNDKLVDLSRPVTINVNGKQRFKGKVKMNGKYMVESLGEFFDPERIFPAAVDVTVQ